MVPHQAPHPSSILPNSDALPPLTRSATLPTNTSNFATTDRSLLAPEDAIYHVSPPRKPFAAVNKLQKDLRMTNGANEIPTRIRRPRQKDQNRSGSRRRKGTWKKLLWVKQSYNYTDQDTFLEHLQRNPRLQPYDFWPLVFDSTVIVQHVCSVIIFIVCFVGIFQERVSPVAVVGWGSIATVLGWVLWDCCKLNIESSCQYFLYPKFWPHIPALTLCLCFLNPFINVPDPSHPPEYAFKYPTIQSSDIFTLINRQICPSHLFHSPWLISHP
ncbi:hypothetical protein B7494_g1352 [Chlorociboria aeruginascens]|nr:hypothetical protein B7494_g1352 [Chlorociboria aeruginascens]